MSPVLPTTIVLYSSTFPLLVLFRIPPLPSIFVVLPVIVELVILTVPDSLKMPAP